MSQMSDPSDPGNPSERGDISEIDDPARRLDGNAAAGMLSEIFSHEMTTAHSTCAHCGYTGPLGSLMVHGGQIGMVLRCPTCTSVQMRLVYIPEHGGHYWMDMRGMARLRIARAFPA